MADANIKKIIISKSELPSVDINNLTYNIRYRIISEDKNRVSHWSRVNNISANSVSTIDYTVFVKTVDKVVSAVWNPVFSQGLEQFDIYIRWTGTAVAESLYPWEYWTTVTTNSYLWAYPTTINTPGGGTETPYKVQVAVQRPTYPKEKENYPTFSLVTLFESTLQVL